MFEGRPSWRALLSLYVPAVTGALVVALVVVIAAVDRVGASAVAGTGR